MKISLLCSDPKHPVVPYLMNWGQAQKGVHEVELVTSKRQLSGGDVLFLISCSELIGSSEKAKYEASLVLHASDLPTGRGWSPHVWELLYGAKTITLSLIEAAEPVDSGRVWKKTKINIPKDALWDEINHALFMAEIELIDYAIQNFGLIEPVPQDEKSQPVTRYRKRTPEDSRLDVNKTIAEQFDLIRVCDPQRYPAFFDHLGHRYLLKIEKIS
ncbi:UDP-glucuronic acid dehydrogenase [Sulfuricystis multivorans]|uniref:UDP-glucuronic acid dehydrogenase n=1 Tax=Sulfuricystis multivorans TaxID=2211108 RepID=UPI000F844F27|nr:UDP-glucuronic acid dehydrogenase [Sulfuricystis multivorans]